MPARFKRTALFVLLLGSFALETVAQNLLTNGGFEEGPTSQPAGWKFSGGGGQWSSQAYQGKRALLVEGTGKDSSYWRTERLHLRPGGLYRLSFFARREPGTTGGCLLSGLSRVNRDFRPSEQWEQYQFIFSVPQDGTNDYLRLGQWEVKGKLLFDEVELHPVLASDGSWLGLGGEAENLEKEVYRFDPNYAWGAANYHRPLYLNRASFNSDRWVFSPGAELIYSFEHRVPEQEAQLSLTVGYYVSGKLLVEASRDAKSWLPVATYDGNRPSGMTNLPAGLFPASNIFIRLSMPGAEGNLQMNSFKYQASVRAGAPEGTGFSHFMDVLQSDPALDVQVLRTALDQGRRQFDCTFQVSGEGRTRPLKVAATNCPSCGAAAEFKAPQPGTAPMAMRGCASMTELGTQPVFWRIFDESNRTWFIGRSEVNLGFLYDPRPGYYLASTPTVNSWWCESGWKIGKASALPAPPAARTIKPITLSAARGEYEAAQLLLRPAASDEQVFAFTPGLFTNPQGESAPISVRLHEMAYVHVTHPTDATAERDFYPDPLPPLKLPHTLAGGQNNGLWLTVHVPRETKAGDYAGELQFQTSNGTLRFPILVHVYSFELPRETHLRSALGLGTHDINRYHNLTQPEERQLVYEKYLQNFAEHRISPYSFFDYAPIDVRFTGPKTNRQAQVSFEKFDAAAAKWLDQYHLNSFLLPLRGMGGGTFQSRALGELEGFKEGTPEHARLFKEYLGQVQKHLRDRGWLGKAYTYWFDEPDPKDYDFVVAGMNRIKATAPGLKRMLTEQPEQELLGHVDIWCGLTPEWTRPKVAARCTAGEEVWWYICCGPKAPYVTEFIDHPGTELRLWPWQSWQYGVQGILIWATTYWSSSSAFPAPALQDPWADPMSYVSGYDFGPGHIGYWGNGDGRFLYPPRRAPGTNQPPCLDGPINSLRWENLRDGMEDYEYFWLLRQAIERVERAGGESETTRSVRALLTIPEDISKDLTHFTIDPRRLLEHRDKIARMIEKLQ